MRQCWPLISSCWHRRKVGVTGEEGFGFFFLVTGQILFAVSDDVEGVVCCGRQSFGGGGREVFKFWVFFGSLTGGGGWLPNVVVGY